MKEQRRCRTLLLDRNCSFAVDNIGSWTQVTAQPLHLVPAQGNELAHPQSMPVGAGEHQGIAAAMLAGGYQAVYEAR